MNIVQTPVAPFSPELIARFRAIVGDKYAVTEPADIAPTSLKLTARELQVALLLSGGLTTRVAAGQLFLSPKTVEYHLRHVYQKLGIRSRTELAETFQGGASAVGRPVDG